jgi:SpoVK/Ycf46/Vps4 family AAA+-type ATPase
MIHVPLEAVVSKWFGESEKLVAKFYQFGSQLAEEGGYSGFILFVDEIDSLVSSRDMGSPHEASRRILSVLLRHIDGGLSGSEGQVKSGRDSQAPTGMLICATNRPQDLDSAFLNRVDSSIYFGLPDIESRKSILKMYAKHLTDSELAEIAESTVGLSGRNLKDLCQSAERFWASSIIRKSPNANDISPPPVTVYLSEAKKKVQQQVIQRP